MSEECCIILTTTDSSKIAESIANGLVEKDLAACVQIDSVKSFFKYEGKCKDTNEYRLMIKAAADNYDIIENFIKKNHNYQLPEILRINIMEGLSEYLRWVLGK